MKTMNNLEIKKIRRSYCIVAGATILAKFRTEAKAQDSLNKNKGMYEYWAGSASVSVDNSTKVCVNI